MLREKLACDIKAAVAEKLALDTARYSPNTFRAYSGTTSNPAFTTDGFYAILPTVKGQFDVVNRGGNLVKSFGNIADAQDFAANNKLAGDFFTDSIARSNSFYDKALPLVGKAMTNNQPPSLLKLLGRAAIPAGLAAAGGLYLNHSLDKVNDAVGVK